MARESRFIDPAFACEVVLSGKALALYEMAKPQFSRLEGIRCLGLIAHIDKIPRHTRHQHLVGLMRIFNKLSQQPEGKGLPKGYLWSFWCRLCYAQTGHAALSYDSEKAVLLACHHSQKFKNKFHDLLRPVISSINSCSKCSHQCPDRDHGSSKAEGWLSTMISKNRWGVLHLWVAALKLINSSNLLSILEQKPSPKESDAFGFEKIEAFKMLVAPGCQWDRPVRNLSLLDFIPRDFAFAGTAGITLDVDALVAAANISDHADWKLLGSLYSYMHGNIYESVKNQSASILYQRALASLLIQNKISLNDLFGIDANNCFLDEDLIQEVKKCDAGKEVFEGDVHEKWKVWPISTDIDKHELPSVVEKRITGYPRQHFSRHVTSKVTCFKLSDKNTLAIAVSHAAGNACKPLASDYIGIFNNLLMRQRPRVDTDSLIKAMCEGLFHGKCEFNFSKSAQRLSSLSYSSELLKSVASIVCRRIPNKVTSKQDIVLQLDDSNVAIPDDSRDFILVIANLALSGKLVGSEKFQMPKKVALQILWNELLSWQSAYFVHGLDPKLKELVEAAQSQLLSRIGKSSSGSSEYLESYALLESLANFKKSEMFRVSIPNLKLMGEDKKIIGEYDVLSISLNNRGGVDVSAWGVTTDREYEKKRVDDMAKIEKFKDRIKSFWGKDIRTVTCYVYKVNAIVCLDIDGHNKERSFLADNNSRGRSRTK